MPQSPTLIEQQLTHINVINLDDGNQAMDTQELLQETQLPPNLTQESMRMHNLLLMPRYLQDAPRGKNHQLIIFSHMLWLVLNTLTF